MMSPRDRYLHDPQFKALVDLMCAHIYQCDYTPSEMRLAAMVASFICEEHRIRPMYVNIEAEKAFRILANIEDGKDE